VELPKNTPRNIYIELINDMMVLTLLITQLEHLRTQKNIIRKLGFCLRTDNDNKF